MGGKRKSLETSRVLHDRIRWDPTLDERAFVVVYEERFTGRRERSFTEFPTDGEIPWHRVWEYRVGELVVWSREQRIDLLFGSGDTTEPAVATVRAAIERWQADARPAMVAASEGAAAIDAGTSGASVVVEPPEALTTYRYWSAPGPEPGEWLGSDVRAAGVALRPRSLVVVTLNVLFDRYDDGQLHTEQRIPAMLELLREQGADLVALQEVTPRTLRAILAAPWVQRDYVVSDGPEASTVEPYGVVLLSRLPMRAWLRRAPGGGHKRTLLAELELGDRVLHAAVVHLTSDRKADAPVRRELELRQTLHDLHAMGARAAMLLGDLNADEGPLDHALREAGFEDLWSALRPGQEGATFDPRLNALARVASQSGRARRLDRVMMRDEAGVLRGVGIERIGIEPSARDPEGRLVPISDHFGLRARLRVERSVAPLAEPREALVAPRFRPTHHGALVMIPPRATWVAIEAIRREHDRAVARWMPHVNLLYGFAPARELGAAARTLEAMLTEVPPFRVTLERLRWFPRRGGATVWLEPRCDPPGALHRLQAAAFELFPWCDEQSRKSPQGYVPHLTVAQLRRSEDEVAQTLARWQAQWEPIEFEVDALAVIHRGQEGPFRVQRVVGLGGRRRPVAAPRLTRSVAELVERLSKVWQECFEDDGRAGERPGLFVAGSHRLGVAEANADLDLVGLAPRGLARAALYERFVARLRDQGNAVQSRVVEDATAPRLALRVDGRDVDLQPVAWPPKRPWPRTAAELAEPDELDADSHGAVLALRSADALLAHAARHGGVERYAEALRRLRRWAAARQVDDNALGYPGGLAWAVMLAEAVAVVPCDPTDEDPAGTLMDAGVRRLARRAMEDWRCDPIGIEGSTSSEGLDPSASPSPMIVLEPADATRNCMRRATATTLRVLMTELRQAVTWLEGSAGAVTPVDPCAAHPWLLVLELHAGDDVDLERLEGFVRGRAVGLVRALERTLGASGIALRPYGRPLARRVDDDGAKAWLALGLETPSGSRPSAPVELVRELERALASWDQRPATASVHLAVWSGTEAGARIRASGAAHVK
ncbi:poly(A) polymerase [Paraliomyxa miuraensis]|uniref:poly(A) polymerase n=1 Tax=Paraliomyxa miuraensis TaxID=376150 RepID=UPI00225B8AEF|nr:poly(A) polymerase [Paraliomyxa miuraensis]MCX4241781.1 RNA repair domain-containing protein [Paraliomyxa miuraensis]